MKAMVSWKVISIIGVVTVAALGAPALADLPEEPGAPASAEVPRATPQPAGQYRFDALRIDGQLRGPAALDVRGLRRSSRGRLLTLRRSFVHRILESIEAPALHGR